MRTLDFRDMTVVITGGTSGIGEQLALDLLRLGAWVTVCSDDPSSVEAFAARTASNKRLTVETCDVRVGERVRELARKSERRYGRVDLLVNNAGYAVYRAFEESAFDEVIDIVDVNLQGAMRCTKAFLPGMIERRAGAILNVSSVAGYLSITPNAAYCAAKHGLVGWSKALNYELHRFGIWVGVLCPDHVSTGFQNHPTFQRRARYRSRPERLTVQAVSAAALEAVRKKRLVTFAPPSSGAVAWAMRAAPWITEPLWKRLMLRRVEQLYDEMARETPRAGVHE